MIRFVLGFWGCFVFFFSYPLIPAAKLFQFYLPKFLGFFSWFIVKPVVQPWLDNYLLCFLTPPIRRSPKILPRCDFWVTFAFYLFSRISRNKTTCFCCTWVLWKGAHSLATGSKGFSTTCITKWGTQTPGRNKLWTDFVLSLERKKNL